MEANFDSNERTLLERASEYLGAPDLTEDPAFQAIEARFTAMFNKL